MKMTTRKKPFSQATRRGCSHSLISEEFGRRKNQVLDEYCRGHPAKKKEGKREYEKSAMGDRRCIAEGRGISEGLKIVIKGGGKKENRLRGDVQIVRKKGKGESTNKGRTAHCAEKEEKFVQSTSRIGIIGGGKGEGTDYGPLLGASS